MTAKKIYLQPSEIVYNGMLDLMDSQNGKEIYRDYRNRELRFTVKMFDATWTLRFTSMIIDRSRSEAAIEIIETKGQTPDEETSCEAFHNSETHSEAFRDGETFHDSETHGDGELEDELRCLSDSVLRREYAMLDAMLLIGTPLEVKYNDGRKIEI